MVTKHFSVNQIVLISQCDICGSEEIIETLEGLVCRACGIVLDEHKVLQNGASFKPEAVQHSKGLGYTQIGTTRERQLSPHTRKFYRLSRLNALMDATHKAELNANKEISTILEKLGFPHSLIPPLFAKFKEIWPQIHQGTTYKNAEKLVPLIIYYHLKLNNVVLHKTEIIEYSKLSEREFINFQLQVLKFFPEYKRRDRKEYIARTLFRLTDQFQLGMEFYRVSTRILKNLWDDIKNTTDDIIAGVCSTLAVFSTCKEKVKINSICKVLNIRMSSIQFHVKEKLFNKFKIDGFTSLARSSVLVKTFLREIGLLSPQELDPLESTPQKSHKEITIKLGIAKKIFNPLSTHYLFELLDTKDTILLGYLEVEKPLDNQKALKSYTKSEIIKIRLIIGYVSPHKDPPLIDFINREYTI